MWCRIKCDGTSPDIYNTLMLTEVSDTWHCLLCKVMNHHYNFPSTSSYKLQVLYTINEIQNLKTSSNLNIFHTNINGLKSKFDNLHEFLSNVYSNLDIIAITEISHKNYVFFYHECIHKWI